MNPLFRSTPIWKSSTSLAKNSAPQNQSVCGTELASTLRLKPCPSDGTGVHKWVYYAACRVVEAGLSDDVSVPLIEGLMSRPPNPADEVESALASARHGQGTGGNRRSTWPERNLAKIQFIAEAGVGLNELREMSPHKWSNDSRHSEEIIDALFPGDPLICVGAATNSFATRARESWRGKLSELQFMVPNPMSKFTGTTKSGRSGRPRTEDNTGPRRFLVVENDFKEKDRDGKDTPDAPLLRSLAKNGISVADLCAAIIHYLTQFRPLALVVHSGGKSLHGWFYVEGISDEELHRFMRYAVALGADDKMWQKCQLARLPDGTRDNGNRQTVHYFNPEVAR